MTRPVVAGNQTATMTAMRQESRLRAVYAVILAGSFSAITLGSAFPQIGDLIPPIAVPAGHFIVAAGIFAMLFVVAQQVSVFILRLKIKRANLRILHSPSVRHQATELASRFGLNALVLRSGGPRDGRISALIIRRHSIVRIGTGALSLAVRKPQDFRFRLAHEVAHLWARDPLLDQATLSSYLCALALIAIGILTVLWYVVTDLISHSADSPHGTWHSSWNSEGFVVAANVAYFSVLGMGLFLERKSAMRLREFHADRVATDLVGPRPEMFSYTASTSSLSLRKFLGGLVESHPGIELRRDAVLEAARSLTGDSILFFLQGYFGAVVLETLLQLLFVDASPTLVGVDVRRAHLAGGDFDVGVLWARDCSNPHDSRCHTGKVEAQPWAVIPTCACSHPVRISSDARFK